MSAHFFVPVGLLLFFACTAAAAPLETTTVLQRGPHEQVVQTVSTALDEEGNAVSLTNTFTQLQTGLNRWSEGDGWISASSQVERVNGMLVARQTQHHVIFGQSADAANGTIDLVMVNGARFRVRPMGIAYTEFKDGQQGKSVFIAELQPSTATLTAPDQVTYFAAFEYGDLAYDLSLAGLEQNVVFRRQLPRPENFQMDPSLVRVECWNQILEAPAPIEQISGVARSDASVDSDVQLDFGPMQINAGRAFSVGAAAATASIRVAKQWQVIGNSVYLIESVPHAELAPLLARLPAQQAGRSIDQEGLKKLWAKPSSQQRGLPVSLPEVRLAQAPARTDDRVASARSVPDRTTPGVNLDWSILGSATNAILKGDTTYFVSGLVTLSSTTNGATVIEGGAIVKFTNSSSAQIVISGPITCQTSPYRPAVFTSKDSDDVGEKITGSTGSPSGYYGSGIYLYNSNTLHDLRFAYSTTTITLIGQQTLTLQDSQILQCYDALYCYDHATFNLENDLFYNLTFLFSTGQQSNTVNAVNLTVHNCGTLTGSGDESNKGSLTNCLLVNLTNAIPFWWVRDASTPSPDDLLNDSKIFQTVGAGSHYLQVSNCAAQLHNTGSTNISPALLARLSRKTTYPPGVLNNNFTTNTTLAPIVPRDDDGQPDIGYHYDPIDYAWSGLLLTNATLTLTNGVAVAAFGAKGTTLQSGSKFISEGNPINLNRLTRYNTVQEQANTNWTTSSSTVSLLDIGTSTPPEVRFIFSDISLLADTSSRRQLLSASGSRVNPLSLTHCQARGVFLDIWSTAGLGTTIGLTNNFIQRSFLKFYQANIPGYYWLSLDLFNNLCEYGTLTMDNQYNG